MGPNGIVILSCKANQLNAQRMASFKWKWMFKNEREITDVHGKYKIITAFSSPNSCQQTRGDVYLRVENLTREDLGTYKCVLFENDMEIAKEDVPFYEYGMLHFLNCSHLVSFDERYITLIIRVTCSLTLIYSRPNAAMSSNKYIWTGRLPHLSGLPHLPGLSPPPYLNRPLILTGNFKSTRRS